MMDTPDFVADTQLADAVGEDVQVVASGTPVALIGKLGGITPRS